MTPWQIIFVSVLAAVVLFCVAAYVECRISERRSEREVDAYWAQVRRDWRKP